MSDIVTVNIFRSHADWVVNQLIAYQRTDNDTGWHNRVLRAFVDAGLAVPVFYEDGRTLGEVQTTDSAQVEGMVEFFGLELPENANVQISQYDANYFIDWLNESVRKPKSKYISEAMYMWNQAYLKDILDSFIVSKHASHSVDHKGEFEYHKVWSVDSPAMQWVRDHIKPENFRKFFTS